MRGHVLHRRANLDRADAVCAVDEVVPGIEGGGDIAALEMDLAKVGQHDRTGPAAVESGDVQGMIEVFFGGIEVAELGEDHPGLMGPPAVRVVGSPGLAGLVRAAFDRGQLGIPGLGGEPVGVRIVLSGYALVTLVAGHPSGQVDKLGGCGEQLAAGCFSQLLGPFQGREVDCRPRPRNRPRGGWVGALRDRLGRAARRDFGTLRNGAYIATVTSSEDELDLAGLTGVYIRTTVGEHVTRYQTTGSYFYLLNGGNAVNFLHGTSVGPFIFLVQAEILAGMRMPARGDLEAGMQEVDPADWAAIAATWLGYFNR